MKSKYLLGMVFAATLTTGCATGLNTVQKREYEAYRHDRVLIEDKAPAAGAALGLLPGGGSFYAREPVFGVVTLLTWPFCPLRSG